eukprot:682258-Pleurochrysis_carterae.AAC.3
MTTLVNYVHSPDRTSFSSPDYAVVCLRRTPLSKRMGLCVSPIIYQDILERPLGEEMSESVERKMLAQTTLTGGGR